MGRRKKLGIGKKGPLKNNLWRSDRVVAMHLVDWKTWKGLKRLPWGQCSIERYKDAIREFRTHFGLSQTYGVIEERYNTLTKETRYTAEYKYQAEENGSITNLPTRMGACDPPIYEGTMRQIFKQPFQ